MEKPLSLYILSGGVGSSGEQLARTVTAQFPEAAIEIKVFPKVFTKRHVEQIIEEAAKNKAVVAHTFVDPQLRKSVKSITQAYCIKSIDLIGPLMENLAEELDQEPLGKPGLYRQLYKSYFDRISAMDFGLDHDDGKNPHGWVDAEIVLLGASRVGKTPISLYLSVMGWKVANIPLIAGLPPRVEISNLDKDRLVGLTIAPGDLVEHRKHRQKALGLVGNDSDYVNPLKVYEEIQEIETFFRRNNISTLDVTGKPIESCADEIIQIVKRKLKKSQAVNRG